MQEARGGNLSAIVHARVRGWKSGRSRVDRDSLSRTYANQDLLASGTGIHEVRSAPVLQARAKTQSTDTDARLETLSRNLQQEGKNQQSIQNGNMALVQSRTRTAEMDRVSLLLTL